MKKEIWTLFAIAAFFGGVYLRMRWLAKSAQRKVQRELSLDLERKKRELEEQERLATGQYSRMVGYTPHHDAPRRVMELVVETDESQRQNIGRLVALSGPVLMPQTAGDRTLSIGRHLDSTIVVLSNIDKQEPRVAKMQCFLEIRDGIPFLSNKSLHDAFKGLVAVNGDFLSDGGWRALCDGDEIQVGPAWFRIELQSEHRTAFSPLEKHQDS